ncbi:Ig domain-containing protein [Ottowia sp.]|uniref:Ig domain-containing protein n=1 Tax=Ottowia sp. TaxID=1898956 RepID=UPI002BC766E2|nr:Ig domain-containing protein [Ottowia sp.]HOB66686.1 Ig domain-containing protein [Ottowia sp.]HPZ58696.1 Ig domain-containing protein [Ottowia sp.]HQD47075.1 Ig domain-containing protein [Ottowia sp.]
MTVQIASGRRLHARPSTRLGRWLSAQAAESAAPLATGSQTLRALVLSAMVGAAGAALAGTHTVTTPGAGTWQVPAGVTQINIVAIGGGGGNAEGVPGGSGAKVNTLTGVAVTAGGTVSYFVGGGGAGVSGGQHRGAGGGGATAVGWSGSGWDVIAAGGGGSGGHNTGNDGRGGDGCAYAFGGYGTNGAKGRQPSWPGAAGQGGKANGVGGSGTGHGMHGGDNNGNAGGTGNDAGRGGDGGGTGADGSAFWDYGGDGGMGFTTITDPLLNLVGSGGMSLGGPTNNILGGAGGGGGGGYWGGGGGGGSGADPLGGRGGGGGGAAGLSIWPGMSPGDTTKGSAPFCVPAGNGGSSTGARGGDGSLTITWQDPQTPGVAPQLSGSAPQGTVGQPYSFTPTLAPANVTTPVSFGLTYFANNPGYPLILPPGLSFNTSTGALTGTPTQVGAFFVGIVANNSAGSAMTSQIIVIMPPAATAGSCGTANGTTLSAAPSGAALCAAGTASAVTGSGPWSWSCTGTNGGSTASCSASVAATNGSCGSANGVATMTPPASNLCSAGTASALSGSGPWTWSCAGNGGTTATCNAPLMGVKSYTAPSPTGGGDITASFTGGGDACGYSASQYVSGVPNANPATPPGISFPMGLFALVATNCNVGETLNFTITYPSAVPAGAKYYKWGPEGANATPHWYEYPATINGNTVTFSLTDGGAGDGDRRANGIVVDPSGVGVRDLNDNVTAVPTLGEWTLMALGLLLAGLGAGALGRRRLH